VVRVSEETTASIFRVEKQVSLGKESTDIRKGGK
jgi:hypothetical protein